MAAKQLHMVRRNLDDLPEIEIPEGYELRTYQPGDEEYWVAIMNTGGWDFTVDYCRENLTGKPQFLADGLFFVTFQGKPVGSACAWRKSPDDREIGWLHMVCVMPDHRGKKLGHIIALAVLHYFRDHGFKEVWLSTDDWRLPAIKSYLRLGFEPHYFDGSHRERWQALFRKLGMSAP